MLDLGEFAEIISKEAVVAILARRLDAAAAMRRADAAVQRLKGVRLPPPHKFTAFPCVAGARNPVASKPPAARGGVRRKLPSADQGAECTVDAVIAEAYNEASGSRFFQVAWSTAGGQAQPVPTWEPESNLAGAQEAITDFWQVSPSRA